MGNNDFIALRLELEDRAHEMGYNDDLMVTLAADFLQGACKVALTADKMLSTLPKGLHLKKELRNALYSAGESFGESATFESLRETMVRFGEEIKEAVKENGIMASTGDCRGACKYNTGDRSEYRNYGW